MGVKVNIDGIGVVEFDDKFKTLSKKEQQDLVNQVASSRRGTRTATSGSADSSTDAMDYARAAMQGVMFGFSDEAAGLFKGIYDAATKGKSFSEAYTEARDKARKNLDDFREDDPLAAYGTEIIASLPTALLGGVGLAKAGISAGKGLGAAIGRAGIEGAAYGLGAGEGDAAEQIKSTVAGGATGAALTGAVGGALRATVAPAPTEAAQRLTKRMVDGKPVSTGVKLTPGQQAPNSLIGAADNILGKLDPIRAAQKQAIPEFNRAAADDALAFIGQRVPTDRTGTDIIEYMDDAFDAAYDDVLPQISIPQFDGVKAKVNDVVAKVGRDADAGDIMRTELREIMDDFDLRGTVGAIDGQTFKAVESRLTAKVRERSIQYAKDGDPSTKRVRDGLAESLDILRKSVVGQTPEAVERLKNINAGYGRFKIVEDAVDRAGGEFSPARFQAAVKKGAKGSKKYARGRARMQQRAKDAREVLDPPPNSGTPAGVFGLLGITNPSYMAPAAAVPLLSPIYRPLSRSVLGSARIGRAGVEAGMPAVGGLLGSEFARY